MTQMTPFEAAPAESGGNRAPVFVAAGLAAALALGGGGYFLLSGSEEPVAGAPISHGATETTRPAAKPVAKPAVKTVPVVARAPLGRDPFKALYVEPATSGSVVAPIGTGTTTKPPTVVVPPASGGGTSGTPDSTPTAPKSYAMTLKKVYGSGSNQTAQFVIGGKTMVAKVGSVFGPTSELKLLSLSQNSNGAWVATVQVGDSDPFDAIQGQKVYVQ